MLSQIGRLDVLGTDIDKRCLAAAEQGQFEEGDFDDTPDDLRQRYFSPAAPFTVARAIRDLVRFESRDLLLQPPPAGQHDLIVCRNVLIYFDRDTQERLFEMFHAALAPNGFLVLGKVETLLGKSRSRFTPVDARERIFRRL
jgi:chemotaxis protein methyltransferase CheR